MRVLFQMLCENALPDLTMFQKSVPLNAVPLDVVPLNAISMDAVTHSLEQSEMTAKVSKKRAHSENEEVPQRAPMQWLPTMSLFVLNRVVELVQKGIHFDRGFKEEYVKRVSTLLLEIHWAQCHDNSNLQPPEKAES